MDQIPAAMDRHFDVVQCHPDGGLLLGASSLTGRYWYGSLWYYQQPAEAPDVEKCTAGVQLEAGLNDACWVDSNRVLVGMDTGGIAVWELTDNYHTFIQQGSAAEHDDLVSSVCVCNGNNTAITASHDKSIKIWDLETFKSVQTYRAHSAMVHCVCSHPTQADVFLSVSRDGSVCLWDSRKQKPAARLDKSPLSSIPTCVAWQPGMEHVYGVGSEAGQLVVKDTRAGVSGAVSCLPHHRNITRIQFSKQRNSLVASVSEDCSVIVTSIADEATSQVYRDNAHRDFIRGISWSHEDQLYTCGWDAQIRCHGIPNTAPSSKDGTSEQVKMEVNGEPTCDTEDLNKTEKPLVNGGGKQETPT